MNIFKYDDYRKIILDLIKLRQKEKKTFSYRWFSQKAGFTSPNILNLVVKGKRHLSLESAEKVIEVFHLKKNEGDFFKTLLQFQKSKNLSEKEFFARELIKFKKYQEQYPISKTQLNYYSDWFNIPIREVFTLKNSPKSTQQISELLIPTVNQVDVEKSLLNLEKLGLIEKQKSQYILNEESISTGNKFASFGVVTYHKKMMQIAAEALDRFTAQEREISSVTIALSEEKFTVLKKMIEDFRDQLMNLSKEDSEKERIYQMNFQLFPLSKKNIE